MTNQGGQTVPEGSVVIPPYEVYNEVRALTIAVRDLIASDARDSRAIEKLDERIEKLDDRVDRVDRKMWFIAGVAAAIGGGIGSAIASALSGVV